MADKTFLEFVEDFRLPMIPDEFGFSQRVEFPRANFATFSNKKGEQVDEFDFASFFPFDNGEDEPYHRERHRVDRTEAGMYFFYRRAVRKGKLDEDHGFEPYPLPTKAEIIHAESDDWPF